MLLAAVDAGEAPGPISTSTRLIAPSLAQVQAIVLAHVPNGGRIMSYNRETIF
jgi:hypothetical protein